MRASAWFPQMHDVLRNIKNMLGGHRNYTKFIIVGRSRTGSNLLRGLLNSHSQIIAYGEVFQNIQIDSLEWDHIRFFQSQKILTLIREDPTRFLDKKLFGKYSAQIAAVGFKIFYYHAQNEAWRTVWSYLQDQRDIKVLHIKRDMLNAPSWKKVMETTNGLIPGMEKALMILLP
jgi:hypothetical protein